MSGMRDGWYISDVDGNTVGPVSRMELVAQHQRGLHGMGAVAWHVDLSEWRPLDRIAAATAPEMRAGPSTAAERAEARAEARVVRDRAEHARANEPRPSKKGAKGKPAVSSPAPEAPSDMNSGQAAILNKLPAAMRAEALKRMSPALRAEAEKYGATAPGAASASSERAATSLRRFFARTLDTFTLGMLGASLAWAFWLRQPLAPTGIELNTWVLYAVAVFAMVPLEALAIAVAGTTPGKALLGLSVVRADGGRVSFPVALKRTSQATLRGIALGIPVIAFVTAIVGFTRYANTGRSSWDANAGTDVRTQPIEAWRWQAALFAGFLAFLGMSSGFWAELADSLAR